MHIMGLAPATDFFYVLSPLANSFAGGGMNQFGCIRNPGIRVMCVNNCLMQVCNHCGFLNDTLGSFPFCVSRGEAHSFLVDVLGFQEKATMSFLMLHFTEHNSSAHWALG